MRAKAFHVLRLVVVTSLAAAARPAAAAPLWTEAHAWAAAKAAAETALESPLAKSFRKSSKRSGGSLVFFVMPPRDATDAGLDTATLAEHIVRALNWKAPQVLAHETLDPGEPPPQAFLKVAIERRDHAFVARVAVTDAKTERTLASETVRLDPRTGVAFHPPEATDRLAALITKPLRERDVFGRHERSVEAFVLAVGRPSRQETLEIGTTTALFYDGFYAFVRCVAKERCAADVVAVESAAVKLTAPIEIGRTARAGVEAYLGQPDQRWAQVDVWQLGDRKVEVSYDERATVERLSVERVSLE